jgi:hypothetical protein
MALPYKGVVPGVNKAPPQTGWPLAGGVIKPILRLV